MNETLNLVLALAREIWERNRGQNIKQIAASLSFTTTLSLVPMPHPFNGY